MPKSIALVFFTATGLLLSACQSTFGPSGLNNTHPAYNQAIINTLNQQMLLNLVRLKYRDEPYFLTISSVTASLNFTGSLGVNSELDLAPGGNVISPQIGISYRDIPTISYQPLHGEDFLKSVLSPIPLESLLVMSQSGWDIRRIFGLCVERINDIHNAPTASGPTPQTEPEYREFNTLLHLFKEFRHKGRIEIGASPFDEKKLVVLFESPQQHQQLMDSMAGLLKFDSHENRSYAEITNNFLTTEKNKIAMRTRSIASILFYLSHSIEVPKAHVDEGLVTVTESNKGVPFDWSKTPAGKFLNIKVSEDYPDKAFLAVPYRNHWFYISDNDLNSKSTFLLLTQLFDLQAGQTNYSPPTLTLPVR